jgi:hypothetical protein
MATAAGAGEEESDGTAVRGTPGLLALGFGRWALGSWLWALSLSLCRYSLEE